jgi:16S rRNA (guanine966-N2)-methyltransferase
MRLACSPGIARRSPGPTMRITGGIYRSRALRAPRGPHTLPTSDRVREALFGILSAVGAIEGARVLDLYAGTGALSFEALSRGAAHATLVESSRPALAALRTNLTDLGLAHATLVIEGDVARAARRISERGPFDLVFADPPWAQVDSGLAPVAIESLVRNGALSDDGLLVLEHAARSRPPNIPRLALHEERRYGDTALAIYKPAILAPPSAP